MPRPNEKWQRKYGNKPAQKEHLLTGADDVLSASRKLAKGVSEAQGIILQALRQEPQAVLRLLDMDDMQMFGQRIVKAYYGWAQNDYAKLMKGVADRDASLIRFINSIQP